MKIHSVFQMVKICGDQRFARMEIAHDLSEISFLRWDGPTKSCVWALRLLNHFEWINLGSKRSLWRRKIENLAERKWARISLDQFTKFCFKFSSNRNFINLDWLKKVGPLIPWFIDLSVRGFPTDLLSLHGIYFFKLILSGTMKHIWLTKTKFYSPSRNLKKECPARISFPVKLSSITEIVLKIAVFHPFFRKFNFRIVSKTDHGKTHPTIQYGKLVHLNFENSSYGRIFPDSPVRIHRLWCIANLDLEISRDQDNDELELWISCNWVSVSAIDRNIQHLSILHLCEITCTFCSYSPVP